MSELMPLLAALAMGLSIGAFFFGGLLWTVRRGIVSPQPAAWFFGSLLVRMSIALTGFYFIGRDQWQRCLLCLVGFILARLIVQRASSRPRQASYAP